MHIGSCSITVAELWGLYQGLMFAWVTGVRWLLMEVDSLCVIQLVASSSVTKNEYSLLILSMQELLQRNWHVHIKHIYRKANFAVDALANYA